MNQTPLTTKKFDIALFSTLTLVLLLVIIYSILRLKFGILKINNPSKQSSPKISEKNSQYNDSEISNYSVRMEISIPYQAFSRTVILEDYFNSDELEHCKPLDILIIEGVEKLDLPYIISDDSEQDIALTMLNGYYTNENGEWIVYVNNEKVKTSLSQVCVKDNSKILLKYEVEK